MQLFLLDEAAHFGDEASVEEMMDRSPLTCHAGWPLDRAHRVMASMGLRHLVVLEPPLAADG